MNELDEILAKLFELGKKVLCCPPAVRGEMMDAALAAAAEVWTRAKEQGS